MAICLVGTLLPDIDTQFFKYLKDHHNSISHAPLFWLTLISVVYGISWLTKDRKIRPDLAAFSLGVFSHLFLDWFGGKTAGILIFYPFSHTVYSLLPLHPERGQISTLPSREWLEFSKFYLTNTFLVISELSIVLVAIIYKLTGHSRPKKD